MKNKEWIYWLRWVAILPISFLGIVLAFFIVIPFHFCVKKILWVSGHPMPGKEFLTLMLPYDGAIAAILFISLGVWIAPNHKVLVALALFLIGLLCAYYQVGEFYSSKRFPAYQPVHQRVWWPIIGTCIGGLSAIGMILLRERSKYYLEAKK